MAKIPEKSADKGSKSFEIMINGKKYIASEGDTIMKVARMNGIFIPGLCGHPDFPPKGNCRICVVEVEGRRGLATSCTTKAEKGMRVKTDTDTVKKIRNMNIELIFSEHLEKCPTCIWRVNCPLLELAERYKIEIKRFPDRKNKRAVYRFSSAIEIDGTQCIDCRNCVDACSQMQKINYLELKGKGIHQEIVPTSNKEIDCIYCGQCAVHCPVGAAQERADWDKVEKLLAESKGKVLVAQFAPSVRITLGEEFGLPYGTSVTELTVTALKQLGFNYVFDVNFGADITTMVEAAELIERIASKGVLPMITSCCPAWVKYLEFYRPDLIPHLTTSRSPHIHLGGVIKTYWAAKAGIDPKKIMVVSVMPCTAKKFEAEREELSINGLKPVDVSITTRELAWLIKKNDIDFVKLKKSRPDDPLGESTGAAAIYGASGGVMESALRTAQFMACGKGSLCKSRLEFKEVRGIEGVDGVKQAVVEINQNKYKVAVVSGIGHIKPVLDRLDEYAYIEVMACVGGCIGGGGQPIPTTALIRKLRMEGLYSIDSSKKLRKAHENKGVLEVLAWLKEKGHEFEHGALHTRFIKRGKSINK